MGLIICLTLEETECVQITTCGVGKAGERCEIICKTADLSHAIIIYKNYASMGSCYRLGEYKSCKGYEGYEISQNEERMETVLTILSLDVSGDTGLWHCSHKTNISERKQLHIYDFRPTLKFISLFSGLEELQEGYGIEDTSQISVKVRLCIYPQPRLECRCDNQQIPCSLNEVTTVSSPHCTGQLLQMYEMKGSLLKVCKEQEHFGVNIDIKIHNQVIDSFKKMHRIITTTQRSVKLTIRQSLPTVCQATSSASSDDDLDGGITQTEGTTGPTSGCVREEGSMMFHMLSLTTFFNAISR